MSEYPNPWTFGERVFNSDQIEDHIAFVYVVENTVNGKKYIGKKLFYRSLSRKPLVGHKRRRRYRKESDWKKYYGSNKVLLADIERLGADKFKRTILELCKTKGEATYLEAHHQFRCNALRNPDHFYNDWIICKVHRAHLQK